MIKRNITCKLFRFSLIGLYLFAAVLFGCSNGSQETPTSSGKTDTPAIVTITTENFVPAETSVEMAKNMAIGWNLGNTLDATSGSGLGSETSWGQPTTTKAMLAGVRKAGFKTIRIPVSWANHTSGSDYTIDSAWMNRVKTVVDWALDEGFCVILNDHHDNYAESKLNKGYALSKKSAVQDKSKAFLSSVWKQIATTFADYDNRLVFEVLNEPRDIDGEVGNNEWWTNDKALLNVITDYEQVCINQIRSVKGNENRFIMAPSYAATSDTSIISLFTLPTDSAKDRLILSVHAYSPYSFAMEDPKNPGLKTFTSSHKNELDSLFAWLNTNYVKKGIGVVIGETGATNKNNLSDRIAWANAFFAGAYKYGIPAVLWDNGVWQVTGTDYDEHYGYYNRSSQTWYFPSLIEAMMKAVYGDSISIDNNGDDNNTTTTDTPETPDDNNGTSTDNPSDTPKGDYVILENKNYTVSGYSNFALDSAVDLTGYKYLKSEVQLITAEDADKRQILLQFFNSSWKSIGDAKTISVSATIYTEILDPEEGPRDLMHIQPVVQETTNWSALTGVQIKIKKITATNTKE